MSLNLFTLDNSEGWRRSCVATTCPFEPEPAPSFGTWVHGGGRFSLEVSLIQICVIMLLEGMRIIFGLFVLMCTGEGFCGFH